MDRLGIKKCVAEVVQAEAGFVPYFAAMSSDQVLARVMPQPGLASSGLIVLACGVAVRVVCES